MSESIKIWKYKEAPPEYQSLSILGNGASMHNGKEDWLTHVPVTLVGSLSWLEVSHGGDIVSRHPLKDGSMVYIRAHA